MSLSLKTRENNTCSICGKSFILTIWKTYYVTFFNPSRCFPRIFLVKCPHCKSIYRLVYPCLYHDFRKKHMIFFDPFTEQRKFMMEEIVPEFRIIKNYIFRLESDFNRAQERVRLLNTGINDKLFEIYRASLCSQIKKVQPEVKTIMYYKKKRFSFDCLLIENDGSYNHNLICDSSPYYEALPSFETKECNKEERYAEMIDEQWVENCPDKPIFSDINYKIM